MANSDYLGLVPVRATIAPARAAYLVREGSRDGFRRAVQEASTRWGGVTELIIPVAETGNLDELAEHMLFLSGVDGLVNVDMPEARAAMIAEEAGLPWVPLSQMDRRGPVRATCHPTAIEGPSYPSSWVIADESDFLWQAVVAGELSAQHLEAMNGVDLRLIKPQGRDGVGRSQLRHDSWLDRTALLLGETFSRPASRNAPTVLWITADDDLQDCWDFWNVRALRPLRFAEMPMLLLPHEDVSHWHEFDKHLLASLDRPDEFSPDVVLMSNSLAESELHRMANSLGLEHAESAVIELTGGYPVTAERRGPQYTYRVVEGVLELVDFERQYGVGTLVDTHWFGNGVTKVQFESLVPFTQPGQALIHLESSMFDGLPRRPSVAALMAPTGSWNGDKLQLEVFLRSPFSLDITVPSLSNALHSVLAQNVSSYSASDKGSLATAFLDRQRDVQALLEPNLFEGIRMLTTPRSNNLVKQLSTLLGPDGVTPELMDLAQSWAIQGKRIYRGAAGINGMRPRDAAGVMERLCALGWAERGLEIKCTVCHSSNFVQLSATPPKEAAKCPACGADQDYTRDNLGLTIFYRLDGLIDHSSDQGVFPHLLAVAELTRREPRSTFLPGVDLAFGSDVKREADLVGLLGGRLTVGEVKSVGTEFTDKQIPRDVEVASWLGADVYVMAAPDEIQDEARELAKELCDQAKLELIVLDRDSLRPNAA